MNRRQKSRFFFSKSVKKSVKRGVRVLSARRVRASHDCSRVLEYAKIRTVLQSKKTRGRGKRKVFTRNFKGEYVETRCLGNERVRSSDEYCVKLERNERKEETEKYHGAFHSIVGFAGKYFLFSPPPPPHSFFCSLSPTFAQ